MSTASIHQAAAPGPGRGATALGGDAEGRSRRHPRHVFGNAVRAVRVFAETAFSVAVLGQYDGRPTVNPRVHPYASTGRS
ncbi:hypothetical protein DVA86_06350 [Streptomyces armeniacus]|uniref:Uncharacterized protein n=1 Tax=Streptomyces armeniacus TaxID=83291 RepID=A0A345XL12_9ACTN|nr:hypothetical protein [Streptomyces armeniacus]AXK32328.1 hypothetical protein DVA86_06350 [Streptomyces armeniacus]